MTEKFTEDIGQAMQTNEVILSDAACIGIIADESVEVKMMRERIRLQIKRIKDMELIIIRRD